MELARAEKIQYGAEGARVPVKEVLVVDQRVVVTQLHEGLVGIALTQPPEPRMRQSV